VTNGVCPYKMKLKKRGDQWWILGVDQMDPEGVGPFPDKEEAEFDMNAIEEMWKYGDKPGYVTVDKPVKREPLVLKPRVEEPPPPKRRVRNTAAAVPATGRKRRKSRKRG